MNVKTLELDRVWVLCKKSSTPLKHIAVFCNLVWALCKAIYLQTYLKAVQSFETYVKQNAFKSKVYLAPR